MVPRDFLRYGSQTAWRRPVRLRFLALRAQYFADLAIDFCRVAGRLVDQVQPLSVGIVHLDLAEQVGGLHDGLNGIAEVVRKRPEFLADRQGNFGVVSDLAQT